MPLQYLDHASQINHRVYKMGGGGGGGGGGGKFNCTELGLVDYTRCRNLNVACVAYQWDKATIT